MTNSSFRRGFASRLSWGDWVFLALLRARFSLSLTFWNREVYNWNPPLRCKWLYWATKHFWFQSKTFIFPHPNHQQSQSGVSLSVFTNTSCIFSNLFCNGLTVSGGPTSRPIREEQGCDLSLTPPINGYYHIAQPTIMCVCSAGAEIMQSCRKEYCKNDLPFALMTWLFHGESFELIPYR